ncbi:hypothetical protein JM16_002731 [Phytophthora kernoviae]|uniref:Uncharacterized protein n=1 Tax=Phytophthora kernoviae TaxID=325452 RepID=A0A8T0M418_9STRA|nr:hypothetical protein JM16_002731 [Phytophthora kernoviae]
MRNPSRERLQNELAYLRRKTVELEDQLRSLYLSRRVNLSLTAKGSLDTQETVGTGARVWRRIAERQAQGRDKSERENKRLKLVLEGQIALAKKLEKLLQKRPDVMVMSDSSGVSQKRLCLGQVEDPSSMYDLFLSELDVLYAQIDSVFQQTGLEASVDDSFRHAYVKTRRGPEDEEELYAELQDVTIIPFELERASSAMWHAVRRRYNKNSYHSFQGVMERPDDTIAVKYRSQCQRSGQDIELDAIMVMCRFVERDRLAFVWRSVSCGDGAFSGMYTDETGWSVLKRVPPDSGLDLTGCVMHNCVHVVPKRVDVASDLQQNEIGLLTNVVIDSYEDDVIALSAMMEDLLLQDTTQGLGVLQIVDCVGGSDLFAQDTFDLSAAVLFPIVTLIYSYHNFDFDHEVYLTSLEALPPGSFEHLARTFANPSEMALFRVNIDSLRINSVLDLVLRISMNLTFCYRVKRVMEALIWTRHREYASGVIKSVDAPTQQNPVPKGVAVAFTAFSLMVLLSTYKAISDSKVACSAHPDCVVYAYKWKISDDLCPCVILIDVDLTPKTYKEWIDPVDAYDKVKALAASGRLTSLQIINRLLLEWPEELRLCHGLRTMYVLVDLAV